MKNKNLFRTSVVKDRIQSSLDMIASAGEAGPDKAQWIAIAKGLEAAARLARKVSKDTIARDITAADIIAGMDYRRVYFKTT
jgi:hypothetical protein